jgi:glyoxylase-like metal-dependent hydrolase (beta-lactamase superfamily II)
VSAYVVVRNGEAAIIDTGTAGSVAAIAATLGAAGSDWNQVGTVVLTHLHRDHIGSLPEVLDAVPDAVAFAHAADIPGIESPRPITPVGDGDELFGLTVVHTPGHTPGHIALLDPQLEVMFAGDAVNGANPGVSGPNPQFTPDMPLAIESARRLGTFDYETVVFGHGEPVVGGAADAVADMAANL